MRVPVHEFCHEKVVCQHIFSKVVEAIRLSFGVLSVEGKVDIRPMMYLALSYDHRIIDGRESVSFLVAVKEALEDPINLLMDGDLSKALEL